MIHSSELTWRLREGDDFPGGRYSRAHTLTFDGGTTVAASASPGLVGAWADPVAVDPEEMLVASVSSCHMLWFLHRARLDGLVVVSYIDTAQATMSEIAPDRQAITSIVLRPRVAWNGGAPDPQRLERLHHEAHERCFIANSLKASVVIA